MSKTLYSKRQERLAELLIEKRKAAGMTQVTVAKAMDRHQPFIANIENGERRVDIVELIELAEIIGFNVHEFIDELQAI